MNKNNTEYLLATYPQLFPKDFHFECGDGWFTLIKRLSSVIQGYINRDQENEEFKCQAAQVKEKFGTLRFYVHNGTNEIYAAIRMAESLSDSICEDCGNFGQTRPTGWIRTLCDLHFQEWKAKQDLQKYK